MELFKDKYRAFMKNVDSRTWGQIQKAAVSFSQHPTTVIFNNFISVGRREIKDYQKFSEEMIATKYVRAIEKHGFDTRYKLTEKGIKALGEV